MRGPGCRDGLRRFRTSPTPLFQGAYSTRSLSFHASDGGNKGSYAPSTGTGYRSAGVLNIRRPSLDRRKPDPAVWRVPAPAADPASPPPPAPPPAHLAAANAGGHSRRVIWHPVGRTIWRGFGRDWNHSNSRNYGTPHHEPKHFAAMNCCHWFCPNERLPALIYAKKTKQGWRAIAR
jgi:hypothetical protein